MTDEETRERLLRAIEFGMQTTVSERLLKQVQFDVERDVSRRSWDVLLRITLPGYTAKDIQHTWDWDEWEYLRWWQKLIRRFTPKFLRPVHITVTHVLPNAELPTENQS